MIRSIVHSNEEALTAIRDLHVGDFECDATYGNGAFWKTIKAPVFKFDCNPLSDGVIKADARKLPLASDFLGSLVLDPPFLTYVTGGRDHAGGSVVMTKRFGGFYSYEDLLTAYDEMILEAHRVLKKGGHLVFKCQDIVHNHRLHMTHAYVWEYAASTGFRTRDLFILAAKSRMPGPQKGQQRHARVFHSYFMVFEK